jgi:glycosyltransferase involved in cell wall biosynthesis
MRVIHFSLGMHPVPSLDRPTGVEHDINCLTNHLVRRGIEVTIIDIPGTPADRRGAEATFVEIGLPPIPSGKGLLALPRAMVFALAAASVARQLTRRHVVDIVHVHNPYAALCAIAFGLPRLGVPIVFTTHTTVGPRSPSLRRRIGLAIEGAAFQRVDAVIPRTTAARNYLVDRMGIAPDKVEAMPVAMDFETVDRFLSFVSARGRSNAWVLCVARIVPRKNQLALLRAVPLVAPVFPEVRFVFVGPIDDERYFRVLQRTVAELEIAERVRFVGSVSQDRLYGYYRDSSVFAFPTLGEMFPYVLIEALTFGLPVVMSDLPTLREIAGDDPEVTAYVDPENPSAVASAICRMLHASRRDEVRRRVRSVAERYSCASLAARTERLYESLLSRHRQ